jgi:hypothetical protein
MLRRISVQQSTEDLSLEMQQSQTGKCRERSSAIITKMRSEAARNVNKTSVVIIKSSNQSC